MRRALAITMSARCFSPDWEDQLDDGLEALIATDLACLVTHWNGAASRLYGWTRDEALGRPITHLTVGPADQRVAEEVMDTVRRLGAWEGDFLVRRKDDSRFLANVRNSIFEDAQGQPAGLIGISRPSANPAIPA
jgi:PAS domain S-box-containing protein